MRCLWIARYMPYPQDAGAKVYSAKLAESLAAAGVEMRFLGFGATAAVPPGGHGVQWVSVPDAKRNEFVALFSRLPNGAAIDATAAYQSLLDEQLREHWDAIVLDGYGAGWALDRCREYRSSVRRLPDGQPAVAPVLVHVSHNHETALWHSMASHARASIPKRLVLWQNYLKVRALELRIVRDVDLVTTITDEDRAALTAPAGANAITLTPGYAGAVTPQRVIDADTPRRVIIVGSFRWVMKQENLTRFFELADPVFSRYNIRLDVVGDVPESLLSTLQARSRATDFHGFVDDVTPFLARARMAVVPELIGGGFKLKFLDYIFARVPVATLSDAAAGLPEGLRQQMLARDDLAGLIDGIVANIDRFDHLNRWQQHAFDLAGTLFRWQDRGSQLRQAISQVRRERQADRRTQVHALKSLSAPTTSS